eukprot:8253989-Karenia_brevis.AAC.1
MTGSGTNPEKVNQFHSLPMPRADVKIWDRPLPASDTKQWFNEVIDTTAWEQKDVLVGGRRIPER